MKKNLLRQQMNQSRQGVVSIAHLNLQNITEGSKSQPGSERAPR